MLTALFMLSAASFAATIYGEQSSAESSVSALGAAPEPFKLSEI